MSHEHHISLEPCSFYLFVSYLNRLFDHICIYQMKQTRCRCIHMYVYLLWYTISAVLGLAQLVCFVRFNCTMYNLWCSYVHGL